MAETMIFPCVTCVTAAALSIASHRYALADRPSRSTSSKRPAAPLHGAANEMRHMRQICATRLGSTQASSTEADIAERAVILAVVGMRQRERAVRDRAHIDGSVADLGGVRRERRAALRPAPQLRAVTVVVTLWLSVTVPTALERPAPSC
jgi:hypothetical protein